MGCKDKCCKGKNRLFIFRDVTFEVGLGDMDATGATVEEAWETLSNMTLKQLMVASENDDMEDGPDCQGASDAHGEREWERGYGDWSEVKG